MDLGLGFNMADWSLPTLTSLYTAVLSILKDRDVDSATMAEAPTTPPVGFIRWNRTLDKFQEWSGAAWVDQVLTLAGGGTGATTAAAARTAFGLGTIATQNANGVAITGGTLTGITGLTLAANLLLDADGTRNLAANAQRINNVYIKNGLLIPVGVDKYITA